jgi:hypothetical protein
VIDDSETCLECPRTGDGSIGDSGTTVVWFEGAHDVGLDEFSLVISRRLREL